MEVPFEREDEEINLIGVQDLQTRHRSNKINKGDSSFQSSVNMDNNGEKLSQIIEDTSVFQELLSQPLDEGPNFDIIVPKNEENNGLTKEQNGNGAVEYPSLPESNGGGDETDTGGITSSFSKIPETVAGLKYVESLFNESSNGVNGLPSDVYHGENIVNKTLILSGQNEIVEAGGSQEVEVGVDEFDVERVIHNQESHDLICPHCNRDITKRVILKRRKRKIEQISGGAEDIRVKPGSTEPSITRGEDLDIDNRKLEEELRVRSAQDGRIDAISCFSCFSLFVPKGDGFLWWKFTPKPAVNLQTDDPSAVYIDSAESTKEYQTEKPFALWILTCCQPYHTEKPVPKPDSKSPLTLEDGKKIQPVNSELPSSSQEVQESSRSQSSKVTETDSELPPSREPAEETLLPPMPELPVSVTPGEGQDTSLWFLTCCQPSENKTKPGHVPKSDKPVDPFYEPATSLDPDTLLVPKRLTPINPVEETTLPPEEKPLLTPVTPTGENDSSLWFVTCCQPTSEKKKHPCPEKPDILAPSSQSKCPPQPPPSKDESHTSTQASTTPDHASTVSSKTSTSTKPATEISIPHETQPLATPAGVFPLWFVTCCQPSADGDKPKPATKQDHAEKTVVSPEVEAKEDSADGTEIQHHDKISPSAQPDGTTIQHHDIEHPSMEYGGNSDMQLPPTPEPPKISETSQIIVPKPLPSIKPRKDIPSPEPEAPPTPPKDEIIVPIPQEQSVPEPSITPSYTHGTGATPDVEQPLLEHPREIARAGVSGLDIIKAIVYGGLLECITSLSVITSAAGGDATTLNIVALGLANVFGGLILLLHNLRVLKHEHTTERYEDQLGRPGHFLLHAIVAVLSYLIFGLMSPIIYGFSFRKSDNKDYKLAALAAASLLCIAILSIGKAYVRRPPKAYFQTFFYYISIAFMVSGVGYVAGDLINMLLKKLGVFDSRTAPVTMSEGWVTH